MASAALPIYGHPQKIDDIKVDSPLGAKLMNKARKLDENNDFTWVSNFSIKFQGCFHIAQWNDAANDNQDVRVETKRLIRFRLCPTSSCSATSANGCSSGYGDYIIDMNEFLADYYDAVDNYNGYMCEEIAATKCSCDNDEYCLYECYMTNNVAEKCAQNNQYYQEANGNNGQDQFNLANYVQCAQAKFQNNNNGNNNNGNNGDVKYYIGPYCAAQGGAIYLGLFTDDTCTTYADSNGGSSTYATLAGSSLPYASRSIITEDCFSCKDLKDYNQNGNDGDADQVSEWCEEVYAYAGKCETGLSATGYVSSPNTNACSYIAGIKIVRRDGIITQVGSKANKTASIFIGIFVVAFVLLAAYVYYLKTKLDRASINISD